MEVKKIIFIIYTAAFLFSGYMLYAQESSSASQFGYYVDKSSGAPVFKQRLVWDKEEYALNYEVIIEIFSGRYSKYYSEITEKTFIEISLRPGRYRYSVIPYDLLGRRCDSSESEWEEFTVNAAFQPEIIKIVPEFFYMDQNQNRVLLISGNNIFDDSIIYLRNEANDLVPINKIVTNNSGVRLTFDDDTLIPGTYELYIKNPGGLDAVFGGFFVGYQKKLETYIKIGYQPVIPLSGELEELFGSKLYPLGVTFRLESLASERSSFKAGLELALSYYNLDLTINDDSVSLFDSSINISMQSRFNHLRNAITFSFGFGLTVYNGFYYDVNYINGYGYDSYKVNYSERNGHMNLGISGLFLLSGFFYIETGVDLTYYLTGSSALIKPKIGLVIKI